MEERRRRSLTASSLAEVSVWVVDCVTCGCEEVAFAEVHVLCVVHGRRGAGVAGGGGMDAGGGVMGGSGAREVDGVGDGTGGGEDGAGDGGVASGGAETIVDSVGMASDGGGGGGGGRVSVGSDVALEIKLLQASILPLLSGLSGLKGNMPERIKPFRLASGLAHCSHTFFRRYEKLLDVGVSPVSSRCCFTTTDHLDFMDPKMDKSRG